MSARSMTAVAVLATVAATFAVPAWARAHHRFHERAITVTRSRGLPVPPDPVVAATPNFTGRNGKTTDVNVFPDLSVGDGFYGTQTPGLFSYGLEGGGLTPYRLQ